jgi:hypothetical protein
MAIDLTRISRVHLGLLGATGGVAYATHWVEPTSLLLGGAVMGVNFWLLRVITDVLRRSATGTVSPRRVATAVAAMALKFALFLGLLGVLFWRLPTEGLSFAFGVMLLLVACVVEAARHDLIAAEGEM